jgi:hypothetical protein
MTINTTEHDGIDNKVTGNKGGRTITIFYRIAVVFFIIGTLIQLPITYSALMLHVQLKNANADAICQAIKSMKDTMGWSQEGVIDNASE